MNNERHLIIDFVNKQKFVTVRQIFYFLVVNNIIPNSRSAYNGLDNRITGLRYEGAIPFESIADVTIVRGTQQYNNMKEAVDEIKKNYRSNWNENFNIYIEVWLEKEALAEIISGVSNYFGVYMVSNKGVSKISQVYNFLERIPDDKPIIILYLGDFDPTGLHIDKVIKDQINKISETEGGFTDEEIIIKRIALTEEQTKGLPENYEQRAKPKDPNYPEYVSKYGTKVWELDALTPEQLRKVVNDAVKEYRPLSEIKKLREGDVKEIIKPLEKRDLGAYIRTPCLSNLFVIPNKINKFEEAKNIAKELGFNDLKNLNNVTRLLEEAMNKGYSIEEFRKRIRSWKLGKVR